MGWPSFVLLCILVVRHEAFTPVPADARWRHLTSPSLGASSPAAATEEAAAAMQYRAPQNEIDRRRNLAIISHPDSGKTTMTERLLLYGGALQQAGAVRQKAEQRATASDFMEMEQERGISISSTVMNFEYGGFGIRLMDTPGHQGTH